MIYEGRDNVVANIILAVRIKGDGAYSRHAHYRLGVRKLKLLDRDKYIG